VRRLLDTSPEYRAIIAPMTRADGVVALGVFVALTALYVVHARIMLAGPFATKAAYDALQIGVALAGLAVVAGVLGVRRQGAASVGLRRTDLRRSLAPGLVAAAVLSAANVAFAAWQGARDVNTVAAIAQSTAIFAVCAVEEEVVFRGHLSTRVHGLVSRPALARLLGVVLFVAVHLPAKMLPTPADYLATFDLTEVIWIGILLLVGYVYDAVFRVTGSLAGPIAAHCLVNISYSLLV
jgi:membrane protease YdiL (CAAX protease family)